MKVNKTCTQCGKLFGNMVVHHRDHDPSNNAVENLMILTNQAEHAKLHAIERAQ